MMRKTTWLHNKRRFFRISGAVDGLVASGYLSAVESEEVYQEFVGQVNRIAESGGEGE